jgi:hypothetical protein
MGDVRRKQGRRSQGKGGNGEGRREGREKEEMGGEEGEVERGRRDCYYSGDAALDGSSARWYWCWWVTGGRGEKRVNSGE